MSRKSHKMIGKIFGALKVLSETKDSIPRNKKFNVKCLSCNRKFSTLGGNIRRHAKSKAKGCKACFISKPKNQIFNKKHGLWNAPQYSTWGGILHRCYNKNHFAYGRYGGRGITVCDEWRYTPINFIKWCTENGWKLGLEIDRIDNDGNYCPSNCRFVTRLENANNTSRNVFVIVKNERLTLSQVARKYNLKYTTVRERHCRGWVDSNLIKKVKI